MLFPVALSGFIAVLACSAAATSAHHSHTDSSFTPLPSGLVTSIKNSTYKHFDCGVSQRTHASDHFNKTIHRLHFNAHAPRTGAHLPALAARQATQINVPTVFHVVTKQASAGTITQSMANQQIAAMNARYNPYGISFTLQGTTFTANDAWAVGAGSDDTDMKNALRQGTYNTLNIYFQTDLSGGILGTCTLPSDIGPGTPDASTYSSDGCNVAATTMPGGSAYGFNTGMTAVHETGHWMGLLHTFEGNSCTGTGDYIADTPVESQSTDGCPSAAPVKDSCPGNPGVDPIHNYMDYSDDACYTAFTGQQVSRMQDLWGEYRQGR